MFKLLKPNLYVARLENIPLEQLSRQGIRGLIIDLDNTITEWNSFEIKDKVLDWFKELPKYNLQPCLVSNNSEGRVKQVADRLGIPFISKAAKPRRKAFRRGMEVLNLAPDQIAVIGDQVFTDVLGGNRSNLLTILVVPMSTREFIGTRFMRRLERLVLNHIIKQEPER